MIDIMLFRSEDEQNDSCFRGVVLSDLIGPSSRRWNIHSLTILSIACLIVGTDIHLWARLLSVREVFLTSF